MLGTAFNGGVAQMARASDSYSGGRWFEATHRYKEGLDLSLQLTHRHPSALALWPIGKGTALQKRLTCSGSIPGGASKEQHEK